MLIYQIVCLLITFLVLEHYVVLRQHSREQRLLPLVLGLSCLYMFYLIVENLTGATDTLAILRHLLMLQMSYLIMYYVLDFTGTRVKMWQNIVVFSTMGIANIYIIYRISVGGIYMHVVDMCVKVVFVVVLYVFFKALLTRWNRMISRKLYIWLFATIMLPYTGVMAVYVTNADRMIIMPLIVAFFAISIMVMVMTGQFERSEEFLEMNFFESYDSMVILLDSDFAYINASDKAKERFGENLLGVNDEASTQESIANIKRILQNEEGASSPVEYMGRYYKLFAQEVKSGKKNVGYIVSVLDITAEMATVENARNESRIKNDFLADMSHELRSPLNAIIGGSEIILKRGSIPETSRHMLNQIGEAGKSLLNIVNSILDYSKLEVGRLELKDSEYDLKKLLERQAYMAVKDLDDKLVKFSLNVNTAIPQKLCGDERRVETLFSNVLANSIRYTERGFVKCDVTHEELSLDECKITFTVSDSGTGMSEESQKVAFADYAGNTSSKFAESTGIGLFIVRELALLMGGDACVTSDGKNGCSFTVSFVQKTAGNSVYAPFVLDEDISEQDASSSLDKIEPSFTYPEAKVLIVDDMKVNREVFLGKAQPWKFEAVEAGSGEESIELVKNEKFDLIFMDQMMPNMSGIEASRIIRSLCDTPIVLLTADTSDEMRNMALEEGLNGYIAKPLLMEDVKKSLEDLLPEDKRVKASMDENERENEMLRLDPNYIYILEAYMEDLKEIIPTLRRLLDENIDEFRVKVHGIKGTSRQIGREGIGDLSEIMEMAAKAGHKVYIEKHIDGYIEDLYEVVEDVRIEMEKIQGA